MTAVTERDQLRYIAGQAADARVNVELETEGMTLNMGPQHPATHGTLRIVAKLDGEQVVAAEPVAGYMHRGYEKLTEVRTYPQVTTLVNRIDWVGSFANEVPFILAAEQLMDIEAPPRAQYIRTVLFEMSRIANIVLFLGDMALQLGGADGRLLRLPRPRVRPQPDRGGHRRALPPELRPHRRPEGRPPEGLDRRHQGRHGQGARLLRRDGRLVIGNEIFQTRTRGIGVIPADVALSYGLSGANLRASGVDWDLRRDGGSAGLVHDKLDWKVWTHPDGDSFARYWVRLQEIREATKIVDQLPRRAARRADHGQGPPHHQGARGRGLRRDREPARRDGLLRRLQGRPRPVPGQDPDAELQQHLDRAVGAPGRLRPRRHHHPRQPLLHPRGHRPVTQTDEHSARRRLGVLAADGAAVARRPRRGADAGRHVRLRVPVQDGQLHAEPARPERGRPVRLAAAARRGRQVHPEGGHRPGAGRQPFFKMAPYLVVGSVLLVYAAVPFGPDAWFADLDVGIFYVLAVSSLSVIGILIAGWASANKYSLIGGLRAAGQLIAYELPMVLAVVGVVIQAGDAQPPGHRRRPGQRRDLRVRRPRQPVHPHAVRRAVHLPHRHAGRAHPDAVRHAGRRVRDRHRLHDRVLGLRFLLFFIGEFASAGAFAAVAATLFLGGWYLPGLDLDADYMNIVGPLVLLGKMMLFGFVIFWVRFTYPRFREDQLQRFAWMFLIPLSLVNILATGVLKVVF